MKILWYIAQVLFIGWLTLGVWHTKPEMKAGEIGVLILLAVGLCAFLTGCVTHSWDWLAARLRRNRHRCQTSGDGLSLVRPRRSLSKAPKHIDCARIGE